MKDEGSLAGDKLAAGILADMGGVHVKQGDLEKASQYFQQSIDINPRDERLVFKVAEIHFDQGNTEKAINFYQLVIELNAEWPRAYRRLRRSLPSVLYSPIGPIHVLPM